MSHHTPVSVPLFVYGFGATIPVSYTHLVALAGAATIKAITTDVSGNVYIAGNFADVVEFGSTDGKAIEKEGMKIDGAFITDQAAGFVAKYDVNGVLKAVQSFVPEALPELIATGMYSPEAGTLYFDIDKISYSNGKLYASVLYPGLTPVSYTHLSLRVVVMSMHIIN